MERGGGCRRRGEMVLRTSEGSGLALLTDLYQLTMVYGYWKSGWAEREAVFHLHFRKWPFEGGFALAAGLGTAVEFLQKFRFSSSDLDYLSSLPDAAGKPLFEKDFLKFLADFAFCCDVDAIPEGTIVFPQEPLLRVKGPLWQAQLLESPMLNLINFQTLIATKAARICMAAYPDPVIEFGMRRAQGVDGALSASRAAFIGGCEGTSDVLAGKIYGIPVRGTHAHSWVMAFPEERQSFETFAKIMPHGCILLVDTYDSIQGTKNAIAVARLMKKTGFDFAGVRLDSGDLASLSIEIRKLLDAAGFQQTRIMASNELDEYLIRDLKQQGARIDLWGVGTHLVTGKGQAALDGVYKLAAIRGASGAWEYKLKLSDQPMKSTTPGILQVRRIEEGGCPVADVIYDEPTGWSRKAVHVSHPEVPMTCAQTGHDVLVPVFRAGRLVSAQPSLIDIRDQAQRELKRWPAAMTRFVNPQSYPVGIEQRLYRKKIALMNQLRRSENWSA